MAPADVLNSRVNQQEPVGLCSRGLLGPCSHKLFLTGPLDGDTERICDIADKK
jgi:hypothetical protein